MRNFSSTKFWGKFNITIIIMSSLACFGGNVIQSATSIYRTTKLFWIRFTHCFFTASSYFSLQTVFKKLLKKPNLVYLKWMLKSHCWLRLTNWEQISNLTKKEEKSTQVSVLNSVLWTEQGSRTEKKHIFKVGW